MSEIAYKVNAEEVEKLIEYLNKIAGGIGEGQLAEIVLRQPKKKPAGKLMTSRRIAEIFKQNHATVYNRIAKFLQTEATEQEKEEFVMSSFLNKKDRKYPMYELTRKGCKIYCRLMENVQRYTHISDGIEKFKREVKMFFDSEMAVKEVENTFLLKGHSKTEYEDLCTLFDRFITGPAEENREIAELTERYERFYGTMEKLKLNKRDGSELEDSVLGVAIEAEMQGFIYGFKLFDTMLKRGLAIT
jgi:hypothetical protein